MSDAVAARPAGTPGAPSLAPSVRRFLHDWGDLAERWGVERRDAQVHGFLFLAGRPVDTRTVAEALSLPLEQASGSLESLRRNRLATIPDRHASPLRYACPADVAEMCGSLLEFHRRRQVEPAIATLRDSLLRADCDEECDDATRRRMEDLQTFLRDASGFQRQMTSMPSSAMRALLKMGAKLRRALGVDA